MKIHTLDLTRKEFAKSVKLNVWTEVAIIKLLANKHFQDFGIAHVKNGPSWFGDFRVMDFVAINKSWTQPCITVYEIKTSYSDFKGDSKWPDYLPYCHRFYFISPKGVISGKEVRQLSPAGLIHVNENGYLRTVVKPLHRPIELDTSFLYYMIMNKLSGDRYPFHSSKADFFEEWLRKKELFRDLGQRIGSRLAVEMTSMQDELKKVKNSIDIHGQLVKGFHKELGVRNCWDLKNHLKEYRQLKLLVSQNVGSDKIKSFELMGRIITELEWCVKSLKPLVIKRD